MDVQAGLYDSDEHVVRPPRVVVHRIPLFPRSLLRVWRGALLGEVNYSVRLVVLEELKQQLVFLGDIDVHVLDLPTGQVLPRLHHTTTRRKRKRNGTQTHGVKISRRPDLG